MLDYLATTGVDLSPEIKDYGTDLDSSEVAAFVTAVRDRGLTTRTYVQSFNPSVFAVVTPPNPP